MANQFLAFPKQLVVLLCLVSVAGAGCWLFEDDGESGFPYEDPDFLTPVAEAEEAGVKPYWLGEEFEVEGLLFEFSEYSEFQTLGESGVGLKLQYGANLPEGRTGMRVYSFSEEGGGAALVRDAPLGNPGVTLRDIQVGPWEGELLTSALATREVNAVTVFVDVGETVVVVRTNAGSTGVPGTDVNPLIQSDLLIEVVAENLRPYPE